MSRPLCFDRMPSRSKPSGGRALIDFDAVYQDRIHPAVQLGGFEPPRALPHTLGPGGTQAAGGTGRPALVVLHPVGPSPGTLEINYTTWEKR